MISGEKILVTGASGTIGRRLATFLAGENDVWGVARFADAADPRRAELEAAGVTTHPVDLGSGDFDGIPEDFTYVLHLGWIRADLAHLQDAMRVNVEGTGLLLEHCRRAKAALVMSSMAVYSAHEDPWHLFGEDDPIGQSSTGQTASSSPASKLGAESVARFCARAFDLPVVIPRLNVFHGTADSYPARHISSVLAGRPMLAPNDPSPHSPIHVEDMKVQLEAMFDAASTNAYVVNWCGDDVSTAQEWIRDASAWSGKEGNLIVSAVPGGPVGAAADPARRLSITGPCTTTFPESFRALYETIAATNAP
jgi:nucleoside-diphosphate-sugar epimerase